MTIVFIILGLVLILAGAHFLTDGASDLAKRLRVSDFVIGVTVVAIGTSTPELVVSFMSALAGKGDMAVGNVLGSNLFNLLFILGVTALIAPIRFTRNNLNKDILFGVLSAVVLFIVASDTILDGSAENYIGRNEGLLMLGFFVIFLAYTVFSTKRNNPHPRRKREPVRVKHKLWVSLVMVLGGLGALVYGGDLFLDNAIILAWNLGVSEAVIAVTLLAGGTSLPELSASVISALKGKTGMALGNIVGSNITNVFLILGASATAAPFTIGEILPEEMIFLIATSALLLFSAYTFKKNQFDRIEGVLFIMLYIGYIIWVLKR